jgi:ABC-type multidrug transport system ATPase subunit
MSSVDRRPTSVMRAPTRLLRIGRDPSNDLVVPDLSVSRVHAELRNLGDGRYEIADLGSHNGTFVNGRRIASATTVTDQDIVGIGRATFRLFGDELREFIDEGDVSLVAQDLTVRLSSGKILLDHVSFPIPERSLVGVIGPSGAGKSTLLGALTGMRPATEGTVLYDNRDLYTHYAELRHRIGLVPQDNILHAQLKPKRALRYAAELRFPGDTSRAERDRRVDEVIDELALTAHCGTRTGAMSGGQQKRVNVALELLTKPSLLFLDEPTSGLDPGLDKSVMELMSGLAKDGRTVIIVTHSVANLGVCDRLLVLVPGGRVAFYGPPAEGLRYFGKTEWAEVFQAFDAEPDRDWAGDFNRSPYYAEHVAGGLAQRVPEGARESPGRPPSPRGPLKQVSTLCRRYLAVIASDRSYLAVLGIMPIVIGLLLRAVPSPEGLAGKPGTNGDAESLLLVLIIGACFIGAANSVRELVKERSIYARERAAGLSSGTYLFSKIIVLGIISGVQALLLVVLGLAGRQMPAHGSLLKSAPLVEIILAIVVLSLASMALGLLVSSLVSTSEKAMPLLVMLAIAQVILSGGVLPLNGKIGLNQLSWIAPSRWGFASTASTVKLNVISPPVSGLPDPVWEHKPAVWLMDMGLMVLLAVIFTIIAWRRLVGLSPGRKRR